jgi:hypothetical protein
VRQVILPRAALIERIVVEKDNDNTVIAINEGDKRYNNLPFIFSDFQSPSWWIDTSANVHVCSSINMFSSY